MVGKGVADLADERHQPAGRGWRQRAGDILDDRPVHVGLTGLPHLDAALAHLVEEAFPGEAVISTWAPSRGCGPDPRNR